MRIENWVVLQNSEFWWMKAIKNVNIEGFWTAFTRCMSFYVNGPPWFYSFLSKYFFLKKNFSNFHLFVSITKIFGTSFSQFLRFPRLTGRYFHSFIAELQPRPTIFLNNFFVFRKFRFFRNFRQAASKPTYVRIVSE